MGGSGDIGGAGRALGGGPVAADPWDPIAGVRTTAWSGGLGKRMQSRDRSVEPGGWAVL